MIKVTKKNKPAILTANASTWKNELLAKIQEIAKERDKDKIVRLKKEKDAIEANYRHSEIKDTLEKSSTKGKCMYCESWIKPLDFGDIEHFHPKSLYPDDTFNWDNLLLSCRFCNRYNGKGAHDTKTYPIINPEKDAPEDCFIYRQPRIEAAPNLPTTARSARTITVCDLHRVDLVRPLFDVYLQFRKNENDIKYKIDAFLEKTQNAAKTKHLGRILQDLNYVKALANDDRSYAGYLRYLLRHSSEFTRAGACLNQNRNLLGMNEDFTFEW